ncbi:MAG: hypothetical protein H8E28_10925 [Anaerolineae bacterium]|nr:hypothetical protein [Anaerolineae bacterium]MBL6965936.1 hypothetical protein [Anaerolineales bacterium]
MALHVDHKGKYFTDVISKEGVRSVIQTLTVRIVGDVHVRPGQRFKDEMNKSDRFIAVTSAVIYNARGEEIYQSDFMTINLDHVVWLSPVDEQPDTDSR